MMIPLFQSRDVVFGTIDNANQLLTIVKQMMQTRWPGSYPSIAYKVR